MRNDQQVRMTRREWLTATISTSCAFLIGSGIAGCGREKSGDFGFLGGRQVGILEFVGEGNAPLNKLLGSELDGRLFTDLSSTTRNNLVTPTEQFYIRSRSSDLLDLTKRWTVRTTNIDSVSQLLVRDLKEVEEPQGTHLMECSGNARTAHFGMISVAEWRGVSMKRFMHMVGMDDPKGLILISGFDKYKQESRTSISGASWIFQPKALLDSSAFMATSMNGQPLSRDHGAPVRLVVPGWYGCASIKWVNEVRIVQSGSETTSQMQEYAVRTHQKGVPRLAVEYEPPSVDPAAMPVRVEEWVVDGERKYRVVGIVWGETQPSGTLMIQFDSAESYQPVEDVLRSSDDSWGVWTHAWKPRRTGLFVMRLRFNNRVRTRRLDVGFYGRTVEIKRL